jgi:hypothetical protein
MVPGFAPTHVSISAFRDVISLLLKAASIPCSVPGLGRYPAF